MPVASTVEVFYLLGFLTLVLKLEILLLFEPCTLLFKCNLLIHIAFGWNSY